MFLPEQGWFSFRLRRTPSGAVIEGVSLRYTAIALIGLAGETDDVVRSILIDTDIPGVAQALIHETNNMTGVGDVALALWAGAAVGDVDTDAARRRLLSLDPARANCPTVELAWAATALALDPNVEPGDDPYVGRVLDRLIASFVDASALFPHWPVGAGASWFRSHVSCFADLVYPVQALAHYHRRTGDERALNVARQCADAMCGLQGADGQWWWHFDVRTGRVIERYPVYAVHQDAMAPMALLALEHAGGGARHESIRRGLAWLDRAPEIDGSLIDDSAKVIWRKVGRHEPGKLARSLQAATARLHPSFRVPGLDTVFRPGRIDYESRPYHLGWLLHAFPGAEARAIT